MIPFGDLFMLLNLCLQTLNNQKVCIQCLRSLNLGLEPINCLEHSYFNHPLNQFYSVNDTPLRLLIQKRITLVYNLLFFLEESLMKIAYESERKVSSAILKLLFELRHAKVFPTIEAISQSNYREAKRDTESLKITLKPKLLNICRLVQIESSFAAHLNTCDCQLMFKSETDKWVHSETWIKETVNQNRIISLDQGLCFECIEKNQCNHTQSPQETYQFLNRHRLYQYRAVWKKD